jgi:hypothetical protein
MRGSSRYQKVILDNNLPNSNSDWGEIRHGAPQRSILGQFLFLLYINYLPKIVSYNIEVVLYVDNTIYMCVGERPHSGSSPSSHAIAHTSRGIPVEIASSGR